jgi:hypothetical protein
MDPVGQETAAQAFEAALSQAQASPQALVPEANPIPDVAAQPVPAEGAPAPTIKLGEEEMTMEQIRALVEKGKSVAQWEAQRPGYNMDSLYADYTKKAQRLAELEKQIQPAAPQVQLAPEEQLLLQKAVSPMISNALQEERDHQALEFFKKSHPEYSDGGKWEGFAGFFNSFYKLPNSVEAQLMVMEMAHQTMSRESDDKKKQSVLQGQALADLQKLQMASQGGGGQKAPTTPHDHLTPEQQKVMKDWNLI